jgi:hypothetical protein
MFIAMSISELHLGLDEDIRVITSWGHLNTKDVLEMDSLLISANPSQDNESISSAIHDLSCSRSL